MDMQSLVSVEKRKRAYAKAVKAYVGGLRANRHEGYASVARRYGVRKATLIKKVEEFFENIAQSPTARTVSLYQQGRKKHITEEEYDCISLVAGTLDLCGEPVLAQDIKQRVHEVRKTFRGAYVKELCPNSVTKIIKRLREDGLMVRSARRGEHVRTTKSDPRYVIDTCEALTRLCRKYNIDASRMYVSQRPARLQMESN